MAKTNHGDDTDSARSKKTPQASDNLKALRNSNATPASHTRKKGQKKKTPKPRTTDSANEDANIPRKRRTPKNDNTVRAVGGDTERDDEILANLQAKPQQRTVQVKQRSFSSILDTSSSTVAVSHTAPDTESAAAPAQNDGGGFASGHYGLLLETKRAEKLCLSLALQKRHVECVCP
ncbi:unnamed protein product [Phytophthora lilii]|uniref:Unnamed protein product n=1 Tax=Phytophthora lilii TaxID=2077276 RepID=A0A9W6TFM0_9STRA|nr:unnamed protein product [Phytophthora lilii]